MTTDDTPGSDGSGLVPAGEYLAGEYLASEQLVEIVDEENRVLRIVPRGRMRAERLRHRSVFVAVMDAENRLLIHRRSSRKDVWPGWCDIAVGGVVGPGEDVMTAARREVNEEIGLVAVDLESLDGGVFRPYDDDQVSLLGWCFLARGSGPLHFRDGEVVEAWWSTRPEFDEQRRHQSFLPDSEALLLPLLTMWN